MNNEINITSINNQDSWSVDFLTEKSNLSRSDPDILKLANAILLSETLSELVQHRYLDGKRFLGWTSDGSKGYTVIETGDIRIKKTEEKTEPLTLGYECINSKNRLLYRKIGIKYAFEEKSVENRRKFAN